MNYNNVCKFTQKVFQKRFIWEYLKHMRFHLKYEKLVPMPQRNAKCALSCLIMWLRSIYRSPSCQTKTCLLMFKWIARGAFGNKNDKTGKHFLKIQSWQFSGTVLSMEWTLFQNFIFILIIECELFTFRDIYDCCLNRIYSQDMPQT